MAVRSRTRSAGKASIAIAVKAGKLTIGMSDYDPEADRSYGGDDPVPGNYTMKLTSVKAHVAESSGNASILWQFEIKDRKSPYDGWPYGKRYTNLDPDSTLKQTQAIIFALTGKTSDVALDLSDTPAGEKARAKFIKEAKLVRGRIVNEPYNGEDRAKLSRVMPYEAPEPDDEEDDFEDAEEFDEVDEEEEYDEEDVDEDEEEDDEDLEDEDEDEEDEEDDEEEEEEPEPEPAPRRRPAAKKAAPATRAAKKAAPAARRARR